MNVLKIGKSETLAASEFRVADFEEASRVYCEVRDDSGEGASTFPDGKLLCQSGAKCHISYNGKIWKGEELVYSPYAKAAS